MKKDETVGNVEEPRMIFEDMSRRIKDLSEAEHETERARSPLVKTLGWLCLLSALIAAGVGVYGIYNLPYAPIREGGGVYYGSYDTPSNREDYEKYQIWSKAFFISFGVTFALGFSFAALDSRERRRHKLAS
ncbi:MAG: hypothetical protein ACR2F2_11080 [Pyrinomonadaceae bacterium]